MNMAGNKKKVKKRFKDKFHDYMMRLSRISPSGVNDKDDRYYYHMRYFSEE